MGLTKSLVEITHDEGYGPALLEHINLAFVGKDMRAERIVTEKDILAKRDAEIAEEIAAGFAKAAALCEINRQENTNTNNMVLVTVSKWQPLTRGGHEANNVGPYTPEPTRNTQSGWGWTGEIVTKPINGEGSKGIPFFAVWRDDGSYNKNGVESEFDLMPLERSCKYRKKPVLIDAWLWDETRETYAVLEKAGMPDGSRSWHATESWVRNLRIPTRLGTMSVEKGYWIIKDSEGIFSICTPETFAETYEAAE